MCVRNRLYVVCLSSIIVSTFVSTFTSVSALVREKGVSAIMMCIMSLCALCACDKRVS